MTSNNAAKKATTKTQSHRLNLYLFLETVDSFEQCLKQEGDGRRQTAIGNNESIDGISYRIILIEGEEKHPKWFSLIQEYIQEDNIERLTSQSKGVIVLISTPLHGKQRYFALTGGYCHHALDKERLEPNFGLYTTLNSIDPDEVKLFDARHIGFQAIQKRVASNTATSIGELGFEYDAEILRIVSGTCVDKAFGSSVSGSDSLHLTSDVMLKEIAPKLATIYDVYKSDKYKSAFHELDYIQPERDIAAVGKLNQELVDAINRRASDLKLSMAYPDQIDYSNCDYFQILVPGIPRNQKIVSHVGIPVLYQILDLSKKPVTIEDLKSHKIVGYSGAHDPLTGRDSIFSYLVFETDEINGHKYVLSNRNWYRINADFIKQTDADLLNFVPNFSSTPPLKPWTKIKNSKGKDSYDEGQYNLLYKGDSDFLYLDKQWFQKFGKGNRKSRTEIADLFHLDTKKLICVKKGREAASLSALWAQGSVSADLFQGLPAYRDEFLKRVRDNWLASSGTITGDLIKNLTFCFAIGTEQTYSDIVSLLPVFSRINLLRHARLLKKMNFKVEVACIQQI